MSADDGAGDDASEARLRDAFGDDDGEPRPHEHGVGACASEVQLREPS